jgi:mRNA interferase MazF
MTVYSRGDVVLVRFPFTSAAISKQRPAIVVSSNTYNQKSPDVMIASVTSQLKAPPHPGDHLIADWKGAGLLKPSLAQTKIATIEQGMIRRRLGHLGKDDWAAVEQGLRTALDLK